MKRLSTILVQYKFYVGIFLAFLHPSFTLWSETAPSRVELTEEADLGDYLAYAALNNPGLQAAFDRWKAALEKIPQVKALPDPRFTFTYFIQEVETRVGPQSQRFGLMQTFPWLGKLKLKGDVASLAALVSRQQYENVKLRLFYRVKEAYYEYYYLTRALTVTDENIQLLQYLEEVMRTRYKVGLTLHADLIRIQVELERLREQQENLRELFLPVRTRLNAALSRQMPEFLTFPEVIPSPNLHLSRDQLISLLEKNNPELKSMDYQADFEELGIRIAKKNYWPDVSLGLDYIITGETGLPGVPESGKDPIMVMVSIQLPLWLKKNKAAVNEANARYQAASQQKREKENDLLVQLDMVYYQFRAALRQTALYRDALLPKARQSLNVTQSAFESGKVDFLNLIDSIRTLLNFELAYERSLVDSVQRLAELEMLVGTELSSVPSELNEVKVGQGSKGEKQDGK